LAVGGFALQPAVHVIKTPLIGLLLVSFTVPVTEAFPSANVPLMDTAEVRPMAVYV
jgi:hypothetical protein